MIQTLHYNNENILYLLLYQLGSHESYILINNFKKYLSHDPSPGRPIMVLFFYLFVLAVAYAKSIQNIEKKKKVNICGGIFFYNTFPSFVFYNFFIKIIYTNNHSPEYIIR